MATRREIHDAPVSHLLVEQNSIELLKLTAYNPFSQQNGFSEIITLKTLAFFLKAILCHFRR
jgi:hypothetical protein